MEHAQRVKLPIYQAPSSAIEEPLTLPQVPFMPEDVAPFERSVLDSEDIRPLRTSRYVIYVDLPDDATLLIHGYTGAYDRVSRKISDALRRLDQGTAHRPLYGEWSPEQPSSELVEPLPEEAIKILTKRGYLTRLSMGEEESYFTTLAARIHMRAMQAPPNFILIPTYQCNLRCGYCFQDHMRTDPAYQHLLRFMSTEMVDRLLRGMATIESAHGLRAETNPTRHVMLFGGEPLLREARSIVEYIVRRLLEQGPANISAVTNGTEIDAYADLLGPEGIRFLQITIDGPPVQHDQRRIYADGSGSFDIISRNIDMALRLGVKISLRMNVDRHNVMFLPALAEEIERRGWNANAAFSAYVAPVNADDPAGAKTTFNSWELGQALRALGREHSSMHVLGKPDDGLEARVQRIFQGRTDPLSQFRADFCGAHNTMYILDPFADIYACWERTGDPSVRIGRVTESGEVLMNRATLEQWRSRSTTSNPICRKCRYAMYCGGGCAILAEGQNGTIHSNYCDAFAKRFRESAAKAHADHLAGVNLSRTTERICDL